MAELACAELEEITSLPLAGTPQRLEWDTLIRHANELYPDWSSLRLGNACLSREAYDKHYNADPREDQ